MPNVKSGTLLKPENLIEGIKLSKQGQIEFRVNENADIMAKIGLRKFSDEEIEKNFHSIAAAVAAKRPEVIKGNLNLNNN